MRRILSPVDEAHFRDRVCDAVTDLLAEIGNDDFNMRQLARKLGVSAMTTYRYFRDKDEILAAVRARGFARLADKLEAATERSGSIEQRFVVAGRAYVEFARAQRAYYGLMFNHSQLRSQEAQEFLDEESRAREAFVGSASGFANAGLCDRKAELIALILWSSLNGIMSLNLSGKISDSHCDDLVSETIRLLVQASGSLVELRSPETTLAEDGSANRTNGTGRRGRLSQPVVENAAIS